MGKGASLDTATDLLDIVGSTRPHVVGAGSGEGMTRAYFTREVDPEGGKAKVWTRTRDAVLIRVDEGEFIAQLAQRNGQTTLPVIRQAWSGEMVSPAYSDPDKNLRLDAHSYRWALIAAVQPELAGPLLDDTAGGTAQRMLWLPLIDPDATDDRPDWPGRITWQTPAWDTNGIETDSWGMRKGWLKVAPEIEATIVADRLTQLREGRSGHQNLVRLKLAALFAVLDERMSVGVSDWEIAGRLVRQSDATAAWMRDQLVKVETARSKAAGRREATRKLAADSHLNSVDANVEWLVAKVIDEPGRKPGHYKRMRSGHRRQTFDDALERAVELGRIAVSTDGTLTAESDG
jgi:hypothetical protein